ncbi:DUF982 domain-containing protein [Chelativorans alearense]|uniref:DUF982 domain-containing protein n=1 Tax=Chelativorans alearense TaxID=2681495 RepID=UPI0013D0BC90|nr:DUF982 domain-containing protein [Chelativorans alearense]
MTAYKFDQPISVFLGLGFPRDVNSVLDAYDLLLEWNGIPDLDYHAAVDICSKALSGERTVQEAQEAFRRFANNRGILSERVLERTAKNVAQDWSTFRT